jgi:hypothetical protein
MKVINTVVAVALISFGVTSVCHAWGVDVNTKVNNNRTYNTNNSKTTNTSSADRTSNANRTTTTDRSTQRAGGDAFKDTKNSFNRSNSHNIEGDVNQSVLGNMNLTNHGNASASGAVGSVSNSSGKKGGGARVGSIKEVTGHTSVGGSQNVQLGSNTTSYGNDSGNYEDNRTNYKEDNSTGKNK